MITNSSKSGGNITVLVLIQKTPGDKWSYNNELIIKYLILFIFNMEIKTFLDSFLIQQVKKIFWFLHHKYI